jgi:Secretion system C-terminal sorting domain
MKKNFTLILALFSCFAFFLQATSFAQCSFTAAVSATESRCTATGIIKIQTTGGSGNFNYKISGPIPNVVTSSNVITGLPPGTYKVEVTDIVENCTVKQDNVIVAGNYQDPRFQIVATDITCTNNASGSLTAINIQYGRPILTYQIVAPSPAAVGTTNTTGFFNNLPAGTYSVRLTDSCGGIQTRLAVIANYNWWVSQATVTKAGCTDADAVITVTDNKGNTNILNPTVFAGFTYGVSKTAGDTVWFTSGSFRFLLAHKRSVTLIIKDACGNKSFYTWTDTNKPAIASSVTISSQGCSDFKASVTGQLNLTNPVFNLLNSSNVIIASNGGGVFNNVPYGSYCIQAIDACYDTTIKGCFTVNKIVPSVAAAISFSNKACSTFTATVTGQTNLFNPQYCLYDNANLPVSCNITGVFNNVPYGNSCIRIISSLPCYDTVIYRCFTVNRPVPLAAAVVSLSNQTCTSFTATVTGQANLTNPLYCIYTSTGVSIACNTTGIFNGLSFGSYCINIKNDLACYDTTIVRCFTVNKPIPSVASTVSLNRSCSTFTATITGQTNLTNPAYCLFDNTNTPVSCNLTGVFTNLPYGSYCIKIQNDPACYDTLVTRCFSANLLKPSVSNSVNISNETCTDFRAEIQGETNLTNPNYCLFNSANVSIACNTTGRFNNVAYGSYCIKITTPCYDTTITRCFTVLPPVLDLTISSSKGCFNGFAVISANFNNGTGPYVLNVYNPGGLLVKTVNSGTGSITISDLPMLPSVLKYMFVGSSSCASKDTVYHALNGLILTRAVTVNAKCPGGTHPNGYGDATVTCTNNAGSITPKIIVKNGVTFNMTATSVSGSAYAFPGLDPATYIVEYTIQSPCTNMYYDTFLVKPYVYPSLDESAVYQCNNNSFTVSAAVTGGIGPLAYEIIGSLSAAPSIVTAPQSSPLFNINTGASYSLVNLRAVDACGNGTVNDASVLPLGNTILQATSNCYYNDIALSVPAIPNVTYSWYKKTSANDSVFLGTGTAYNISYLLPKDTGIYVAKAVVNNGCLTQLSTFTINGQCGGLLLSVNGLQFDGALQNEDVKLHWKTEAQFEARAFVVERSNKGGVFADIGTVNGSANNSVSNNYYFIDNAVPDGLNQYRLRVLKNTGASSLSDVVKISKNNTVSLSVMPNPVTDAFEIQFAKKVSGNYDIKLVNAEGKVFMNKAFRVISGEIKHINRPSGTANGVYFLVVQSRETGEKKVFNLIFR